MRCESVLIRLDELLRGELKPEVTTVMREHLDACRGCAEWQESVDGLARQAPQLMGESPISFRSLVIDRYALLEVRESIFWVAWSSRGIRRIGRDNRGERGFLERYDRAYGRPLEAGRLPGDYREQIVRALNGRGSPRPEVDLGALASFERTVLSTLLEIPLGEVRSYAWVAREAGRPRAVRAVGNACARNPVPFLVPCHRVVPTGGGVGGYAFGTALKRSMLSREGVDLGRLDELGRQGVRYVGSREGAFYCFPTCVDARRLTPGDTVPLHNDREALANGFTPCDRCRSLAYQAS